MNEGNENNPLWCLHIHGPDDMHPAPSKAHAELGAHLLNEWVSSRDAKDEGYPGIEGVVAIWPYSPEAHAAEAGEFVERFIYPSSLTCGKVEQQGREVGEAVAYPGMELAGELWPAVPIYEFDFGDEGRERYIRLVHVPKIKALYTAAPKQQAVDKETLMAFERVFWKAVELSGSRDFDHDVCKEVRDFRSLLAALPGKTGVE